MARLRVQEIAKKRGLENAHQLQLHLGITPAKASRLWNGTMDKIGLDTIEHVCLSLDCSPSDLFVPKSKKNWPKDIYRKR